MEGFPMCEEPATCLVYERYLEDHLYEEHVAEENRDLDEGLGDFLRDAGFQRSVDFLPIQQEATCDHFVGNPLLSETMTTCGKQATFAKMVVEATVLCDEHAVEWGYTPT